MGIILLIMSIMKSRHIAKSSLWEQIAKSFSLLVRRVHIIMVSYIVVHILFLIITTLEELLVHVYAFCYGHELSMIYVPLWRWADTYIIKDGSI